MILLFIKELEQKTVFFSQNFYFLTFFLTFKIILIKYKKEKRNLIFLKF